MRKFYINFLNILFAGVLCAFAGNICAEEFDPQSIASLPSSLQTSPNASSPLLQQLAEQAKLMQEQQKNSPQLVQRRSQPANANINVNTSANLPTSQISNNAPVQNNANNQNNKNDLNNAGNVQIKPNGNLYNDAFDGVVDQMLPMSPEQIKRLRSLFNESQKAASMPVGVPQRPVTSSVLVNLSPQSTPPVIRLGAGYISSLVFMDSTGQPWAIQSYSIGDPSAFNIQWDQKGSTLLIQASSYYKRSNLAVILKGLDTPVMLTLLSGQEVIDYRVDLRVPGLGPNAVVTQSNLPDSANPILLDVLNGIPPTGSKTLKVSGADAEAWLLKDRLFVRTAFEIISPAWKAVMNSADGTHAYELQPTPVILALQRGKDKTITLTLEGID